MKSQNVVNHGGQTESNAILDTQIAARYQASYTETVAANIRRYMIWPVEYA